MLQRRRLNTRKPLAKSALLAVACLLFASPAPAHHSRANFDLDNLVRIEGEVLDLRWGNPHIYIRLRQSDGSEWLIEGHSIPGARRLGWRKDSVVAGDTVRLGVFPDRRPGREFALLEWLVLPDGQALRAFQSSSLPGDVADEGEASLAREQPALQPSTDFSGNWRVDFSGVDLRVSGFKPGEGWPLTERGREAVRNFSLDDDPVLDCVPSAIPRVLKTAYGYRFDRLTDRLVVQKEHDDTTWTIWLGDDALPVDPPRSRFGVSRGTLLDDSTLVVETSHFLADKWGLSRGIDSSAQKRVSARYELQPDGLSIRFSYTVSDPVYLTAPVSVAGVYLKEPDRPFIDETCDVENAKMHLQQE